MATKRKYTLTSKPKNCSEEELLLRLQNNFALGVEYEYIQRNTKYFLDYSLRRDASDKEVYNKKIFLLIIEEGKAPSPLGYKEDFTKRDAILPFDSALKAIKYLKKNEYFVPSDWSYLRRTISWGEK